MWNPFRALVRRLLRRFGLQVSRIGGGFIDVRATVADAKKKGLALNDCIELNADDPAKRGRRDRVLDQLLHCGALDRVLRVCEIGPGTGRYTERIIGTCQPRNYDIYETHRGWRRYLLQTHGTDTATSLHAPEANGTSLGDTPDNSCELVHAHAVFVYLPVMTVIGYITEMLRVCRNGGHICFDYIAAEDFDADAAARWSRLGHNWPVLVPRHLVQELGIRAQATLKSRFAEPYGGSQCEYVVWQKNPVPQDPRQQEPANQSTA